MPVSYGRAELGLPLGQPAGILLVNLASREVVHANPVAVQLAPGVALPAPIDDWSDAAALRDVDGRELSASRHPLSQVARSQPLDGQPVTAARSTELGPRREPLWVLALPIAGAAELTDHALVVLLPLRDRQAAEAAASAAALAAERTARSDAEVAHTQLALLAEATSQLSATLDVGESVTRLASLVVPVLADWVVIVTAGRERQLESVLGLHRDGHQETLAEYAELVRTSVRNSPFDDLLAGAPGVRMAVSDGSFPTLRDGWASPRVQALADRLGVDTVLYVPLPGRRTVLGAMALIRGPGSAPYTDADLSVAADLGRRAGLTLDNAGLYQSEHRVAVTLQQSLLPTLPSLPGLEVAARYLASENAAEVGGDFYEIIPLPNAAVGLAVGDIVGHDIAAAAAMGHLRGMLRACAWNAEAAQDPTRSDPARVLIRLDRLIQGLEVATLATAAYATLERIDGSSDWRITWSNAGHPPLLVRNPDLTVSELAGAEGLMLGVDDLPRTSTSATLAAGSVILGYTDGLVERRGRSLDVGLALLQQTLAGGPAELEHLANHIIANHGDSEDDVALILVRLAAAGNDDRPPPAASSTPG